MKNYFFIGFILLGLLVSNTVSAQGNLQFNNVKYYELSGPYVSGSPRYVDTFTLTVPPNKALKIENISVSFINYDGVPINSGEAYVSINEVIVARSQEESANNVIWFPGGSSFSVALVSKGDITINPATVKASISALEFNVIP